MLRYTDAMTYTPVHVPHNTPSMSARSETLNKQLERKPENFLYHYTSARGLKGILESKKIWATNIKYLNDEKEFLLVYEYAAEEAERRHKSVEDELSKAFYGFFLELIGSPKGWSARNIWVIGYDRRSEIFTGSFSENGDVLSQWRGYCPNGGYSIGFNAEDLFSVIEQEKPRFKLQPCIYDEKVQRTIIENLFDTCFSSMKQHLTKFSTEEVVRSGAAQLLSHDLGKIAPLFKHHSFQEEREGRLVRDSLFKGLIDSEELKERLEKEVLYRDEGAMLKPYVEFPLPKRNGMLTSCQIKVSPMKNQALAVESVRSFAENHVEDISVEASNSSFKGF
ncbi:DUF2971 domain-containing protein [soil metagenome]